MDWSTVITVLTTVGGTSLVGGIISIIANRKKDRATASNTDASSAQILTNIAVEQVRQFQNQVGELRQEMSDLKVRHYQEMTSLNTKVDQLESENESLRTQLEVLTGRVDRGPTGPSGPPGPHP